MAIDFKKLKTPILDFQDKLTVGKFKDCRICDIIEDQYEYLIWANRNGMIQLSKPVIAKIHYLAAFAQEEEYFDNEIAPYMDSDYQEVEIFPDVPY